MSRTIKAAAPKALKDSNLLVKGKYSIDMPRIVIVAIWRSTIPNRIGNRSFHGVNPKSQ